MTEKKKVTSVRHIDFLGKQFSIDVLMPPKTVNLPPHNILDGDGKDTGILCPRTEGVVSIVELLDVNLTHKITIRCESADKPFSPKGGWVQCRTAASKLVKI